VGAVKDGDKLVFLYKVEKGACLESFGVRVAEMANVPGKVIAEAKRKATEVRGSDGWSEAIAKALQHLPS